MTRIRGGRARVGLPAGARRDLADRRRRRARGLPPVGRRRAARRHRRTTRWWCSAARWGRTTTRSTTGSAPVKQLIRDCVAAGTPVLGICLGHQLIAAALGGTAERNPLGQQVGVFDVGWLPEAGQDELVRDLGPVRGIQWNHDLVTALPDGAVALARTPQGELQVARFAPRAWGVQLHPEADEHIVVALGRGRPPGTPRPRDRPGRPDQRDRAGPARARRGVAADGGQVRGARPRG